MNIQLKESIRNYIYSLPTKDCLSVTLTMKQVVNNEYLDQEKSVTNFRHFLNLLNKRVYGNAHKRFKKSVSVIPVLEKPFYGRFHYHLILEKPTHIPQNTYELMIVDCWTKTRFGYYEVDVKNIYSNGWTDYITKFVSETDTVDWVNFHW